MLSFCAARYRVANLPLLTSLLLAGSLSPASAAELLNPVVVTGTLTEKTVNDSPVRTEVVMADSLARILAIPAELPLGVLISLIGGPFFLWLLLHSHFDKQEQ